MGVRQVSRQKTVPWCTCVGNRQRGYIVDEKTGWLVHAPCLKPAKMYWESKRAPGQA